jgi:hypothetical protein
MTYKFTKSIYEGIYLTNKIEKALINIKIGIINMIVQFKKCSFDVNRFKIQPY